MKILKIFLIIILYAVVHQHASSQTTEVGLASYYHDKFEGKTTASGQVYDKTKLTAAHRKLPFNTKVRVTNLVNNQTIIVTINDRGPFKKNRIIDVSKAAAIKLDIVRAGIVKVKIEVLENN